MSGLSRHRLVVAGCIAIAATFGGLSAFDLSQIIERPATIDKSFNVTYASQKPDLPANLSYFREEGNPYINNRPEADDPASNENLLRVVESNWFDERVGFIEMSGNIAVKPNFAWASNFNEGLAAAKPKDMKNANYGYIDKSGKYVIPPTFNSAGYFHNGVAIVTTDSGSHLINKAGKVLFVGDQNSELTRRGSDYVVRKNGKLGLIDKTFQWVIKPIYESIQSVGSQGKEAFPGWGDLETLGFTPAPKENKNDYLEVSTDGSNVGVVDRSGKILIEPQTKTICCSFNKAHGVFESKGKYRMVDASGKTVIGPTYDYLTPYDDLIAAKELNKFIFLDNHGNKLPLAPVDSVITVGGKWLSEGLGAVVVDGKCGFVDSKGNMVIAPKFRLALPFQEGYAPVWDGIYWRFINKHGDYASDLKFSRVSPFVGGKASVDIAGAIFPLVEFGNIIMNNHTLNNWMQSANHARHQENVPSIGVVEE
jgi:hypothetical protein